MIEYERVNPNEVAFVGCELDVNWLLLRKMSFRNSFLSKITNFLIDYSGNLGHTTTLLEFLLND